MTKESNICLSKDLFNVIMVEKCDKVESNIKPPLPQYVYEEKLSSSLDAFWHTRRIRKYHDLTRSFSSYRMAWPGGRVSLELHKEILDLR